MRNPLLDQADIALSRFDHSLAEKLFRECLAEDPRNAEALRELALIEYSFKKDSVKAKELIEDSINLENSPWAHFYLGMILDDLRVYPRADEELEYAIKSSGGLAVLHSMYGDILVAQERFEEAQFQFEKALSKEPDYEPAKKSSAKLLSIMQQKNEATNAGEMP